MFKKDLDKDIAGDTSGNFAKLLLALVQVASMLTRAANQHYYTIKKKVAAVVAI